LNPEVERRRAPTTPPGRSDSAATARRFEAKQPGENAKIRTSPTSAILNPVSWPPWPPDQPSDPTEDRRSYTTPEARSEAVRDLFREALAKRRGEDDGASRVGVLSYVYDHDRRDLARTLTHAHHDHHHHSLSTLHLHLDAHACLKVSVLKGSVAEVQAIADRISAERGVRFGQGRLLLLDDAGDP